MSTQDQEPDRSKFAIQRASLRDQIRHEVRARIIRGEIPAESRLIETELAQQLGVSRTPLREALIALEQEGFLETEPGKGFRVQGLTNEGYKELHEIIGTLERLALSLSAPPMGEQIQELRTLNEELRAATGLAEGPERAERRLQVDLLFHETLLERCPNRTLLSLLSTLKRQWRRYEYAFWSLMTHETTSADQHDRIIDALAAGDMAQAAELLMENWKCWMKVPGGGTPLDAMARRRG